MTFKIDYCEVLAGEKEKKSLELMADTFGDVERKFFISDKIKADVEYGKTISINQITKKRC